MQAGDGQACTTAGPCDQSQPKFAEVMLPAWLDASSSTSSTNRPKPSLPSIPRAAFLAATKRRIRLTLSLILSFSHAMARICSIKSSGASTMDKSDSWSSCSRTLTPRSLWTALEKHMLQVVASLASCDTCTKRRRMTLFAPAVSRPKSWRRNRKMPSMKSTTLTLPVQSTFRVEKVISACSGRKPIAASLLTKPGSCMSSRRTRMVSTSLSVGRMCSTRISVSKATGEATGKTGAALYLLWYLKCKSTPAGTLVKKRSPMRPTWTARLVDAAASTCPLHSDRTPTPSRLAAEPLASMGASSSAAVSGS
mmetsp:Transcript_24862/g.77293  ORF Transcript_24862/g.77293 Transcript_24862/m.77293 type:complete len:309 (+) Transcript_24862:156-1082(+)